MLFIYGHQGIRACLHMQMRLATCIFMKIITRDNMQDLLGFVRSEEKVDFVFHHFVCLGKPDFFVVI